MDTVIQVRVSSNDKESWRQAAEAAGKDLSAWIRDACQEAVKNPPPVTQSPAQPDWVKDVK